VMFPRVHVRVLTLFLIFPLILRVPALVMLGYWFVLQVLGGVPQLTGGSEAGVAFWAHVGGFVTGLVVALALRGRTVRPAIERRGGVRAR
jgi:membrane associated rhomboid family serine protease